jgi:hypothetical protein
MYLNNISAFELVKVFEQELPTDLLDLKVDCLETRYRFISENYNRVEVAIYDCIAKHLKLQRKSSFYCWGGMEPPKGASFLEFGIFIGHVKAAVMGMGDACLLLNHFDMRGLPQYQAHRLIDVDYARYQVKFEEMVLNGLAREGDFLDIGKFPGELNIHATGFFKTDFGYEFGYLTIKVLHNYIVDLVSDSNDKRVMKHYPHEYGKIKNARNEVEEQWPLKIKGSKKKVDKIKEVNEHVDRVEEKLSEKLKRELEDLRLSSAWLIKEEGNAFHPHFTLVVSDSGVMESIRLRQFNEDFEVFQAPVEELDDILNKYLKESHNAISLALRHK